MFAQSLQFMFMSFEDSDCNTLIVYLQAVPYSTEALLTFTGYGYNLPEL
jgi:hypothetical protein